MASKTIWQMLFVTTFIVLINLWIYRQYNNECISTKSGHGTRPDQIYGNGIRPDKSNGDGIRPDNTNGDRMMPDKIKGELIRSNNIKDIDEYVYVEYERYVTAIQTQCNEVTRCGGNGDSGYDICVDSAYKPKQPCLVYSFGSNFVFDFEFGVLKKFNCEIHTFDPSRPVEGHNIPNGVNFHLIGLTDNDHINKLGWEMKTLSSIREYLNHSMTHLDILKIDIEGYEWHAIPQIISSVSSTDITQLVVELHFGRQLKTYRYDDFNKPTDHHWGSVDAYTQLNILKKLKLYGFHIFSYQKNPRTRMQLFHSEQQSLFTCYVIALKNMNSL